MTKNTIYLGIGSNTNADTNLPQIVRLLRDKLTVVAVSSVFETPDTTGEHAPYLNAAVVVETALDPEALKAGVLVNIEDALNRTRPGPFVTADVDILLVNDEVLTYAGREVPDPSVTSHAYAAVPLADVAPGYIHPVTGETLARIAARLGDIPRREDVLLA